MSKRLNCVLLIDDDEDDNFLHQLILVKANITEHIHVAENGIEALRLLVEEKLEPELIFLDINMPKMDGWEFLDSYRKLVKIETDKTVIIILTTSINPAEKERSKITSGVAGFQSKPMTESMIKEILQKHF